MHAECVVYRHDFSLHSSNTLAFTRVFCDVLRCVQTESDEHECHKITHNFNVKLWLAVMAL